jgi:PAS domain-containing protein
MIVGRGAGTKSKHLILILAREFASKLATPMFVADAKGDVVYYNEAAERVLGRPFAEGIEMSADEWVSLFHPETLEGRPMELTEMAAGIAFLERRTAHGPLRITGLDGHRRTVAVTAFPLFARADEFVGMVAIFWEQAEPKES